MSKVKFFSNRIKIPINGIVTLLDVIILSLEKFSGGKYSTVVPRISFEKRAEVNFLVFSRLKTFSHTVNLFKVE